MEERYTSKAWLRWEKRCLARVRRGEAAAVAELYEVFAQPLYSKVLLPRLGDADAAQDALAETFKTAIEKLDTYVHKGVSIWHWLSRIAANKATDMYRVKARTTRALTSFESLRVPLIENPGSAHGALQDHEDAGRLQAATRQILERINPRYRKAIELRFFEEMSRAECAAELEVQQGNFDVILLRALRAFRQEWERVFKARPDEI